MWRRGPRGDRQQARQKPEGTPKALLNPGGVTRDFCHPGLGHPLRARQIHERQLTLGLHPRPAILAADHEGHEQVRARAGYRAGGRQADDVLEGDEEPLKGASSGKSTSVVLRSTHSRIAATTRNAFREVELDSVGFVMIISQIESFVLIILVFRIFGEKIIFIMTNYDDHHPLKIICINIQSCTSCCVE